MRHPAISLHDAKEKSLTPATCDVVAFNVCDLVALNNRVSPAFAITGEVSSGETVERSSRQSNKANACTANGRNESRRTGIHHVVSMLTANRTRVFRRGHICVIAESIRGHTLSLSVHHAPVLDSIRLDTCRALLEHGYGLDCWCSGCRRWASYDLAGLVAAGLGYRPILACRPRCRLCAALGKWQVRPASPTIDALPEKAQARRQLTKGNDLHEH